MVRGKYVVGMALDSPDNRRLEAILFSDTLTHKQAAELFGFGEHVVSAGFYDIGVRPGQDLSGDGTVYTAPRVTASVFGESETLGIGGQDFDLHYVKRALALTEHDESRRMVDYGQALEILQSRPPKR